MFMGHLEILFGKVAAWPFFCFSKKIGVLEVLVYAGCEFLVDECITSIFSYSIPYLLLFLCCFHFFFLMKEISKFEIVLYKKSVFSPQFIKIISYGVF